MDELEALGQIAHANERLAGSAFAALKPPGLRFLHRSLRSRVSNVQDREDVIAETWHHLWRARLTLTDRGIAAWYALLRRTAEHCRVDLLRRQQRAVDVADVPAEELADGELADLEDLATAIIRAGDIAAIDALADARWLGLTAADSHADHHRRLLAVQLFYLDGACWSEIVRLVGGAAGTRPPVDRATLDDWCADAAVLRHLAYSQLHQTGDELASAVLAVAAASLSLNEPEMRVLEWRYRHNLTAEQIGNRTDCELSNKEVRTLLDRLRARLPFRGVMEDLCCAIERRWLDPAAVFRESGLWQRLAFQYRYRDDLTHRDIHERTADAGAVVGYSLTLGMLNVWLSNGRLLRQLAADWRERSGGTDSAA